MRYFLNHLSLRQQLAVVLGPFLVQIFLLPVTFGLFADYLQTLATVKTLGLPLVVGLLLLISFVLWIIGVMIVRPRPKRLAEPDQAPARYPGLIVIPGTKSGRGLEDYQLSHIASIEYHLDDKNMRGEKLRACWLIATPGENGSIGEANRVRDLYGSKCDIEIRLVHDVVSIQATYDLAREIYDVEAAKHRLRPEHILADFTGGTKPMSLGLALAAHEYSMQYVYGGKPGIKSQPVSMQFRPT